MDSNESIKFFVSLRPAFRKVTAKSFIELFYPPLTVRLLKRCFIINSCYHNAGKLEPKKLITHHFKLDEIIKAYDTFGNAEKEKALKLILINE